MRTFILLSVLFSFLVLSNNASATATQVEHYQVQQDTPVKVVIAANSGLPMALCSFKDSKGGRVVRQVVTVVETLDSLTIIETRLYSEQVEKVSSVECES